MKLFFMKKKRGAYKIKYRLLATVYNSAPDLLMPAMQMRGSVVPEASEIGFETDNIKGEMKKTNVVLLLAN